MMDRISDSKYCDGVGVSGGSDADGRGRVIVVIVKFNQYS
jgi:hypothetical protein